MSTAATDTQLVETTLSSQVVYRGEFLSVRHDTVRLPDGEVAQREHIVHPGAVVVVAILDNGHVLLERQFRYPLRRVMVEFPAGKLEPNEDTLACAMRELQEETGYVARQWAYAGAMHIAIAYTDEIIHIYFARDLTQGRQQLDVGEHLELFTASPKEVLAMCEDGRITDSKTTTCALWLQNVLSGAWNLRWQTAGTGVATAWSATPSLSPP